MNQRLEDTADYPVSPVASAKPETSKVETEAQHLRLRSLAQTCPLIERMEEQEDVLTLHLSASNLSHIEGPRILEREEKPVRDFFVAAGQCGYRTIVLAFPENIQTLRENTAGIIVTLHRQVAETAKGTTILLRGVPPYFRERLRIHQFDRFLTIEESPAQAGSATH